MSHGRHERSRRAFCARALRAAAGVVSAAAVWRCGSRDEEVAAWAAGLDPALDCSDVSELWPAEVRTRETNEYVPRSPHPDRFCFHCTNFRPADDPRACGGCDTVKGPIDPGGWCKSWTESRSWTPPI
jgi:hypothetical protein